MRSKAGIRIDICKVQKKSTALLKLVDKLARAAAKSPSRIDRGFIVGKIGRAKIKGNPTSFPAANQVLVIRVVRSRTVGKAPENRFVFEVFDENAMIYISKHYAYCTPEIGAQLHRQRGFRVRMNDNPTYPQIVDVIEEVPLPKPERKQKRSAASPAQLPRNTERACEPVRSTSPECWRTLKRNTEAGRAMFHGNVVRDMCQRLPGAFMPD
jgi:hypothetical protein